MADGQLAALLAATRARVAELESRLADRAAAEAQAIAELERAREAAAAHRRALEEESQRVARRTVAQCAEQARLAVGIDPWRRWRDHIVSPVVQATLFCGSIPLLVNDHAAGFRVGWGAGVGLSVLFLAWRKWGP